MREFNSSELLSTLEKRVEKHLDLSLKTFQNLNSHELLQCPNSGGWNIAQCLWHLNSYGKYYLPQIEKGLKNYQGSKPSNKFKSSVLGNWFTGLMEPKPGFKKMKTQKNHTPPLTLDAHKEVAEFISQQELLLNYLRLSKQVNLRKINIPISISKWVKLSLGDVFRFNVAHIERHIQQALAVLNEHYKKSS